MDSASRAERNIPIPIPSAAEEEALSMQTARRPSNQAGTTDQELNSQQRQQKNMAMLFLVSTLGWLAIFCWFVQSLAGLDFDTGFIAVFCTLLTIFVMRALISGFKQSDQIR